MTAGPHWLVVDSTDFDMTAVPFTFDVQLLTPPPNDTCPGTVIGAGMTSGNTSAANDDYNVDINVSATCDMVTTYDSPGPDLAYSITVGAGQTLTVQMTPT